MAKTVGEVAFFTFDRSREANHNNAINAYLPKRSATKLHSSHSYRDGARDGGETLGVCEIVSIEAIDGATFIL